MELERVVFAIPEVDGLLAEASRTCRFEICDTERLKEMEADKGTNFVSAQWPKECVAERTAWKLYRIRRESRNANDMKLGANPDDNPNFPSWHSIGKQADFELGPGHYVLRVFAIDSSDSEIHRIEIELVLPFPAQSEGKETADYSDFVESMMDNLKHAPNLRNFLVKLRKFLVQNKSYVTGRLRNMAEEHLDQGSVRISNRVIYDALSAGVRRLTIMKRDGITDLKHRVLDTVSDLRDFVQNAQSVACGAEIAVLAQSTEDPSELSDNMRALRLTLTDLRKLQKRAKKQQDNFDEMTRQYAVQKQVFRAFDGWHPDWTEEGEVDSEDLFSVCENAILSRLHISNMMERLGFYDSTSEEYCKGLKVRFIELVLEEWFRDGTDLRGYESEGTFFVYLKQKVENKEKDIQQQGYEVEIPPEELPADFDTFEESPEEEDLDSLRCESPPEPDPAEFEKDIRRAAEVSARQQGKKQRKLKPETILAKMKTQITPKLIVSVFNHQKQQETRNEYAIDDVWEVGRQTREEFERFGAWTGPFADLENRRLILAGFPHNTLSKKIFEVIPTYMLDRYSKLGRTVAIRNLSQNYELSLGGGATDEIRILPEDSYVTEKHLNFYFRVSQQQMHDVEGTQVAPELEKLDFTIRLDVAFEDLSKGSITDVLIAKNSWIDRTGQFTLSDQSLSCTRPPR